VIPTVIRVGTRYELLAKAAKNLMPFSFTFKYAGSIRSTKTDLRLKQYVNAHRNDATLFVYWLIEPTLPRSRNVTT
jgi:hypothetical protein